VIVGVEYLGVGRQWVTSSLLHAQSFQIGRARAIQTGQMHGGAALTTDAQNDSLMKSGFQELRPSPATSKREISATTSRMTPTRRGSAVRHPPRRGTGV
jgi:hypothetical protein